MIGLGFSESYNNYLTTEKTCFENMQKKPDVNSVVGIAYSKTEMFTMLRNSLLPCLMANLGKSMHEKMPQRLFEIGSAFSVRNGKVVESLRVSFVSEHSKANFSEAKAVAQEIFRNLGMNITVVESDDSSYIDGRCAGAKAAEGVIGIFGEVHPAVLTAFKLEEPVAAGEIEIIREIPYSK
jgi:phenylalanyl-tRNA synthetase beta chain